jgi:hypothetical protein
MKEYKKVGGGIPFARKAPYEYDDTKYEADLKNGDVVKIMDGGTVEMGQWGEQHNYKIKTRNGEKKLALNQKTINVLVDEFTDETENWINKDVKVILKKDTIAGKKVEIVYLVVDGWELDEYGDLVKLGQQKDEDSISPEDIPF